MTQKRPRAARAQSLALAAATAVALLAGAGPALGSPLGEEDAAAGLAVDAPLLADAFVRDGTYADDTNVTSTLAWKHGSANFARQTFLTFDVAALDRVDRATLWLYGRVSGGSENDYPDAVPNLVTEVLDPTWAPEELTWNTRPQLAAEPATTFVLGGGSGQVDEWHTVDLTALVAGAVAGDRDRLGISLSRAVSSGPIVQMRSSRTSTPPRLEINGEAPPERLAPRTALRPTHDAYVRDGSHADTSYGTSGSLQWKVGSAGSSRATYLTFDLDQVQGRVETATLRMYGRVSGGTSSDYPDEVPNLITEVLDPTWSQDTVTWNTRPNLAAAPARTFLIGGGADQADRWHEIDLTDLVTAARADGRSVLSFAITRDEPTAPLPQMRSSESSTPPALEINGPPAIETPPGGVVRSALYPEDWQAGTVDAEGRFLHDFSYAGYRHGADVPQEVDGPVVDVTLAPYGADPTGATDATAAIQAAIDAVGEQGGGTVHLPAGEYQLNPPAAPGSAVLHIPHDNVLLRGDGPEATRVFTATSVNMRARAVVLVGPERGEVRPSWHDETTPGVPLTQDVKVPTTTLHVSDVSGFEVGDWVVLRTDTTPEWLAEHPVDTSRHEWTPETFLGLVYNRQITAVNAALGTVEIDIPTRYEMLLRDNLRMYPAHQPVVGSGVADLAIGMRQSDLPTSSGTEHYTEGTMGYEAHHASAVAFNAAAHGWVDNVHSYRPAANADEVHLLSGGVYVWHARSITVTNTDMRHAQYLGEGGNGYLFHLIGSDTLVRDSYAEDGRHNFLIQAIQATGNVILDSTSKDATHSTELHRHLSVANLFDNVHVINDSFEAQYRNSSTHAHSGTESVMWNISGESCRRGRLAVSQQYGWGYVIGTTGEDACRLVNTPDGPLTAPVDWAEHIGLGEYLEPRSLYLDQRERRLDRPVAAPLTVSVADADRLVAGQVAQVTVAGAQPGSPVEVFRDADPVGTATAGADGTVALAVPLPGSARDADVHVTAVGTDPAGMATAGSVRLFVAANGPATAAPGVAQLSTTNGWTGVTNGTYEVRMNLWWGQNATRYDLYENGELIHSERLTDASPSAQSVVVPVTGRINGTYEYTAVLTNRHGSTEARSVTTVVRQAPPALGVLSHDNHDRGTDYAVTFDMWWGTNGTTYRLYEDGVLVDTVALTDATPAAQQVRTELTGRTPGSHVYRAELENAAGVTPTAEIVVEVR